MRKAVVDFLLEAADAGTPMHVLTADLGFVLFDRFREKHPDKFTNVGVAEANMVGLAAGMALSGKRVYCYSMIPFLIFRTLDQIRSDLCAMNLPVTLIGVGSGFTYGMEGMTHHAIEDIAVTRALPNMTVVSPGDTHECATLLRQTAKLAGPVFMRLGGNAEPEICPLYPNVSSARLGRFTCFEPEGTVAIIATGHMVATAHEALVSLRQLGITCRLYSAHTLKPFDVDTVKTIARECTTIVSAEEHSEIGGLGSTLADILLSNGYTGRFSKIAIKDKYESVLGAADWLRQANGLLAKDIVGAVVTLSQNP